jgi:hypothetical protein
LVSAGFAGGAANALDSAAPKFVQRPSDLSVIVLEKPGSSYADLPDVLEVWPRIVVPNVDAVFLIDGDNVMALPQRA